MQERHAPTRKHTLVQTKNSSCLTFLYTIMLGDSSATPLVPCPPLLVCAMIQWVNLPLEMSGAPVEERMDILVHQKNNGAWDVTWLYTCPRSGIICMIGGLHHVSTCLAFPRGTDVQSSNRGCVGSRFSQGLDKGIFLSKVVLRFEWIPVQFSVNGGKVDEEQQSLVPCRTITLYFFSPTFIEHKKKSCMAPCILRLQRLQSRTLITINACKK